MLAVGTPELFISLVTLLLGGGFVTALIAAFKARPERDAVIITNVQNAAEVLKGTNEALYVDWQRERAKRLECETRADAAEARVAELEEKLDALHRGSRGGA